MKTNQPGQPTYIYVKQQVLKPQILQSPPIQRLVSQVPPYEYRPQPTVISTPPKQIIGHVTTPRASNVPAPKVPDFGHQGSFNNLPIQDNTMVDRVCQLEQQLENLKNLYVSMLSQQQQTQTTENFQNEIKRLRNQIDLKEKVIQKLTDGEEDMNILQSIGDPNDQYKLSRPQLVDNETQRYQQRPSQNSEDFPQRYPPSQSRPQQNQDDSQRYPPSQVSRQYQEDQQRYQQSQSGNSRNQLFQDEPQKYQQGRISDENQKLKDEIEALKMERRSMGSQYSDVKRNDEIKRLQEEVAKLKNQNEKMKKMIDPSTQKYKENADQLNIYLQESLRQLDEFKGEYSQQEERINKLEKQNEILQLEADELRKQLQVQSGENDLLRGQMEQQMKQFSVKMNENDKLKNEVQQAKDSNNRLLDEISRLVNVDWRNGQLLPQIQQILKDNNELTKRIMELEPYCQHLEEQVQSLQNELAKLKEQLDAYEHEHYYYEDLKQKYASLIRIGDQNQDLLVMLTLCFVEIDYLRNRVEQLNILPKLPPEPPIRTSSYSDISRQPNDGNKPQFTEPYKPQQSYYQQ